MRCLMNFPSSEKALSADISSADKTVLQYEHGVAEGKKTPFEFYRLFVAFQNIFPSGKGADEDNEAGEGRVEIGYESFYYFKFIGRGDVHGCAAASGMEKIFPVFFIGVALKSSGDRCSTGENASFFGNRAVDRSSCFFRNGKKFFIHLVFFYCLTPQWRESAETCVQGYEVYFHSLALEFSEDFLCEVQTRRWSGYRAFIFCENRLVSSRVLFFFVYVGRKRDFAAQ